MKKAKSVSDSFPGFLEAGDLDGKEVTLTISYVRQPEGGDKGKDGRDIDKPIVKFEKARKEWVLNKTCARTIRELYGNAYEAWEGKQVTLYPTTCNAFGDPHTPCIRVKRVNPSTGEEPNLFN